MIIDCEMLEKILKGLEDVEETHRNNFVSLNKRVNEIEKDMIKIEGKKAQIQDLIGVLKDDMLVESLDKLSTKAQ